MKKVFVAILAIVYLAVASGVAVNVHYCMGKVASVDLIHSSEKCGMKTNGGCCRDEPRLIKLSDTHKLINNDMRLQAPVATMIPVIDHNIFLSSSWDLHNTFYDPSPPGPPGISLNILYGVFRI